MPRKSRRRADDNVRALPWYNSETDELFMPNNRIIKNPDNFLDRDGEMDAVEKSFGLPVPSEDDLPTFREQFSTWLDALAKNFFFVSKTIHYPAHFVRLFINNTLIKLLFEIPLPSSASSSCSEELPTLSLEYIKIRPSLRGNGMGGFICRKLLETWVLEHGFRLHVSKAVSATYKIFDRLKNEYKASLSWSEPTVTVFLDGLFIKHKSADAYTFDVERPLPNRISTELLSTSRKPMAMAMAELEFFCNSPPTICPLMYSLYMFDTLLSNAAKSIAKTAVAAAAAAATLAPFPECSSLFDDPQLDTLLLKYPWFFEHYVCHSHNLSAEHERLLHVDHNLPIQLSLHLQAPWKNAPPVIHRPITVLWSLVRHGPKTLHSNSIELAFNQLHSSTTLIRFVWDSFFESQPEEATGATVLYSKVSLYLSH